jgi:hypothetical protein
VKNAHLNQSASQMPFCIFAWRFDIQAVQVVRFGKGLKDTQPLFVVGQNVSCLDDQFVAERDDANS